jgi:hypothetical protein
MIRLTGRVRMPFAVVALVAAVACAGVQTQGGSGATGRPAEPRASGSAAAGASRVAGPPGTISGLIFDSLGERPLALAHVHIERMTREAVTDSAGRFRLDSVPAGVQNVWVDHPKLDSLGMFTLSAPVTVRAEQEAAVTLGIPSFGTIWSRSCAEAPPANDAEVGLMYGHVKSVFGWAVDTNAFVRAVWLDAEGKRVGGRAHVDARGAYAACGVPRDRSVSLFAAYQGAATVAIVIPAGRSRIVRRDLTLATSFELSLDSTAGAAGAASRGGEENGGAIIHGTVRDTLGNPINDAHVRVSGVSLEARSDVNGRFLLKNVPSGVRIVSIEAIAYAPMRWLADLYDGDSVPVAARLDRITALARVIVRDRRVLDARLKDFEKRRSLAMGYFVDSTTLQKFPFIHEAINVPGVTVRKTIGGFAASTLRPNASRGGTCPMAVYVDGQSPGEDLDSYKDVIAAIEVYPRSSYAPQELVSGSLLKSRNDCGMILIWTKNFLRPPA